VIAGPEPGYKPALSGLTARDIQRATAAIDMTGSSWVINVSFTSRGGDLFRTLTHDNVNACAGPDVSCAQRHLAIWLDLTQTDIDNWDDPAYAAKVSHPFDFACLARTTATNVCPKFVSDPVTLQEIDGGSVAIAAGFTQQSATELADAINSASRA
jgi:preprotein translocase subunit SecD